MAISRFCHVTKLVAELMIPSAPCRPGERRLTAAGVMFNLFPKPLPQHRQIELVLAQQGQLAAPLQAKEVRQAPRPDPSTRRVQLVSLQLLDVPFKEMAEKFYELLEQFRLNAAGLQSLAPGLHDATMRQWRDHTVMNLG